MSNKTTFTVEGIAKLDISQVKGAVDDMKKGFQGITLPAGIDKRVKQIFSQMTDEIAEFEVKSKSATTNADWSRVLSSGQKIIALYQRLQGQVRQLGDLSEKEMQQLFPQTVVDNIKAATDALKAYENANKKALTAARKARDTAQEEADAKRGAATAEKGKKIVKDETYDKAVKKKEDTDRALEARMKTINKLQKDIAEAESKYYTENPGKTGFHNTKNYQNLKKQLDEASVGLSTLEQNAQKAEKALSGITTQNNLDKIEQEAQTAEEKVATLTQELSNLETKGDPHAIDALFEALSKIDGINLTDVPRDLEGAKNAIKGLTTKQLDAVRQSLEKIQQSTTGAKGAFQGLGQDIDKTTDSLYDMTSMRSQVDQLKNSFMHFFSLTNGWMLLRRGIRQAYESVKELDDAMTEIAVVSDYTLDEIWAMRDGYTKAASDMGVATIDMVDAQKLYIQQGLDLAEATDVATETIKMARIANLDGAEATDLMTAALRGFNMEMAEANRVNDVYSELAAKTAADTEEIATAMSKTASIAANAGSSFENTSAFLAQIIETTREAPETAGTALKTIIARFQELKKAPSEIGEVDGEMVDANAIETALKTAGVELRNAQGEFRNFDDVIMELSGKWNDLDVMTQRYIATMAAGSRQQSRFIALMSDNARLTELTGYAANSAGASNEQFEKTLDSLDSKINKLKNAWSLYLQNLANNTVIKFAIDVLTQLLDTINSITAKMPGFTGSLLQAILTFGAFKAAGALINKAFNALGSMFFKAGQKAGTQYSAGLRLGMFRSVNNVKDVLKKIRELFSKEKWLSKGQKITFTADTKALAPLKTSLESVNQAQAKYTALAASAEATDEMREASAYEVATAISVRNAALEQLGFSEADYAKLQTLGLAQDQMDIALSNKDVAAKLLEIASIEGLTEAERKELVARTLADKQVGVGLLTRIGYIAQVLFSKKATEKDAEGHYINAAAIWMETAAKNGSTVAQWALNAAIYACPLGWILALILAVVAALVILAVAMENAIETDAEKLERLNAEAEKAKEAANEAAEAYQNLRDSLDEYDTAADALNELAVGTQAWKDQLYEVNNLVLELLQNYPELQEIGAITYENGALSLDRDKANQYLQELEQRRTIANSQAIYQQGLARIEKAEQNKEAAMASDIALIGNIGLTTEKQVPSDGGETEWLSQPNTTMLENEVYRGFDAVIRKNNYVFTQGDIAKGLVEGLKLQLQDNGIEIANEKATGLNANERIEFGTPEGDTYSFYTSFDPEEWTGWENGMSSSGSSLAEYAKYLKEQDDEKANLIRTLAMSTGEYSGKYGNNILEVVASAQIYDQLYEDLISTDLDQQRGVLNKTSGADKASEDLIEAMRKSGFFTEEELGEYEKQNQNKALVDFYEKATGKDYEGEEKDAESDTDLEAWVNSYAMSLEVGAVGAEISTLAQKNEQIKTLFSKDYNEIVNMSEKAADVVGDKWDDYSKEAQTAIQNAMDEAKAVIADAKEYVTNTLGDKIEVPAEIDFNLAVAYQAAREKASGYTGLQGIIDAGYAASLTASEEEFSEENAQEYREFLQVLSSDSAIEKATALREGLASTNPIILATAAAYAELGSSAFSAESQINELYSTIDSETLSSMREDGSITATEMLELAESNKTVDDVMKNTGATASDLAEYYNLLADGIISAADASSGFLTVLQKINASQASIDNAFAFIDTFEADRSQLDIASGVADIIGDMRDLYEKGAYADPALKSYAEQILGEDEWAKIEADDNLDNQEKIKKAIDRVSALPEDAGNLYHLWTDFAQSGESQYASMGADGSIQINTADMENLEQLKQDLIDYGYSAQFADAMIADLQTNTKNLDQIFEQMSIKDAMQAVVNNGLLTEKEGKKILTMNEAQIKIIAKKTGKSIEEAKKMIEDDLKKQDIEAEWRIVFDETGNITEKIKEEILSDNVIGDSDLQFLVDLGMDTDTAKQQLAKLMTETDKDFSKVTFGFDGVTTDNATTALALMQEGKLDVATALGLMGGFTSEETKTAQELSALESEKAMAVATATGMAIGSNQWLMTFTGIIDSIFGTTLTATHGGWLKKYSGDAAGSVYDSQINELKNKVLEKKLDKASKSSQVTYGGSGIDIPKIGTGYDSPGSRENGQGDGGSRGSGGDEEDIWENDLDWLFNLEKKIAKTVRERNALESEYNRMLTEGNFTQKKLLKNLEKQEAAEQRQLDQLSREWELRSQEAKDLQKEYADVSQYVTWDNNLKTVQIDWNKIDKVTDTEVGERIEAAIDAFENVQDHLEQINDDTSDIKDAQADRRRAQLDQYVSLEERLYDAIVAEREAEIEALETINDTVSEANSELLDKIQTGIDDYRTARENEEALSDIEEMEQRLALMRTDTSGANQLDILSLEEELKQARQDYMDNKIDQAIDQLSRQNELAEQQRSRQIELMQWQLEEDQKNGVIANLVNNKMTELAKSGDIKTIESFLKAQENWKGMTAQQKEDWADDLRAAVTEAGKGWRDANAASNTVAAGKSITFTDKNGNTIKGTMQKDGTIKDAKGNTYSGVFLGADGKYHQYADGKITAAPKANPKPTNPPPAPAPAPTPSEKTVDDTTKKKVASNIWMRGDGNWSTGETRKNRLIEVFGSNNQKAIQGYVNQYSAGTLTPYSVANSAGYGYADMKKTKWKKYESGGLADFTGPAWLDGTKARPEYVLNAEQTKGFLALTDMLGDFNGLSSAGGDNYYDVKIEVEEISNDYDVEQMMDKMKRIISDDAMYRNVNAVDLGRR